MSEKHTCVHCGEDSGKYPVIWQKKDFCCEGCKTVYQILNESKLEDYYTLYDNPGIKVDVQDYGGKYAYLDNAEIKDKLIYFKDGDYSKVQFYVPEVHCSSCIWLLENLYQLNKAITFSSVNFIKKEVDITFKHTEVSLRQIVELMASIHYIPMISLESIEGEKNKSENKKLIYKIGLAGFIFGNTMLFSIPEYIPGKELIGPEFKSFFGFMNLILSLPIVFYSGSDYIISAFKNLRHKIINIDLPISIGMLAIFFESGYEILSKTGSGYMDSLAGLVFFLLIGKWYQNKSYQALSFERDYKSYFPVAVTVIKEGVEEGIPLSNLKKGDRIVVRNQELIPADGILLTDQANINYSFVTGESKPVLKHKEDEVYAGGKQIGSTIEVEVTKEVMQSKLTQLWNQDIGEEKKGKTLTNVIDNVSKNFTIIILSIAILTAIFWAFTDPSVIIFAFSSVLIVACPCALALSIPFTFGNTMRIFGRSKFYLKKAQVVESLNKVDTIVFDKTGTITYPDSYSVHYTGDALSEKEESMAKSLARQSGHPLSIAVFESIDSDYTKEVEDYREIPSSGIVGHIDGRELKMGSAQFVHAPKAEKQQMQSVVYLAIDKQVKGYFCIDNHYRNNLEEIISKFNKDFDLHIISGDNEAEKGRLTNLLGTSQNLLFNQNPNDKLNYISQLQSEGKIVLMIGDGLNDAGALGQSNVGISIADEAFNFSPACDAILEGDQFEKLPELIHKTASSIRIVYASFVISFLYNVVGLSFAVSGQLSPIIAAILMPVSSITVVAFVTIASRISMRKLLR